MMQQPDPPKRPRPRRRRDRGVSRSRSVAQKTSAERAAHILGIVEDAPIEYDLDAIRPRTRGECVAGLRPCPWAGCRHHMFLDVTESGSLTLNFPGRELEQLEETCALDVAERGGITLERTGELMNITRERARQIEMKAYASSNAHPVIVELRSTEDL